MSLYKETKDLIIRFLLGKETVPSGLSDLHFYFRTYGPIHFRHETQEDGSIVAISQNFRYGSIITSAKTFPELDDQVKDAIMTAFSVPSSYAKEAGIQKQGAEKDTYAFA